MNIRGLSAKQNLIDQASVNQVSEQLFKSLEKKNVDFSKFDLSKFNRPTVGVDFYNSKTSIDAQREISIANSGILNNLQLKSIQTLNSFAAQALYSDTAQRSIKGEMTLGVNFDEMEFISTVDENQSSIYTFDVDPDKKGSNPFSFNDGFQEDKKEA